jgi:hypothetical protein
MVPTLAKNAPEDAASSCGRPWSRRARVGQRPHLSGEDSQKANANR